MISRYILRALKFVLFGVLFVALLAVLGFVVMRLWNWLMPALFGWKVIGYWQAWGLIILSKILFGGFRGTGGRGGYWRPRVREHWRPRTPEEREQFRQRLRDCWSRVVRPEPKPSG